MRGFATAAILTALAGLLLGAGLAAADPDLVQGAAVAQASGTDSVGGAVGGLLRMVGKPLQGAMNSVTGPTIKTGAVQVDKRRQAPGDGGKPAKQAGGGK